MNHFFQPGLGAADWCLVLIAVVILPVFSVRAGARLSKAPFGSLVRRYWMIVGRGWIMVALIVAVWTVYRRRSRRSDSTGRSGRTVFTDCFSTA